MPTKSAPALTGAQEVEAMRMIRQGQSQRAVARHFGVSQPTIHRLVKGRDIPADLRDSGGDSQTTVQRDYNLANRLLLLNAAFEKAHAMLALIDKPSALQPLVMSIAILIDKRRLEEGEVTNRTEHVTGHEARERVSSKLDQLAQRRARRPALIAPTAPEPEEATDPEESTTPPEPEPQDSAA